MPREIIVITAMMAAGIGGPGAQFVDTATAAGDAADELGYPVVAKLNGDAIAHKTERGLVKLRLGDRAAGHRGKLIHRLRTLAASAATVFGCRDQLPACQHRR